MKTRDPISALPDVMKQIGGDGAFLTVKAGDIINTMTIGWAMAGMVWGKPVLTVLVRPSRHTFGIMEKSEDFTVSVPKSGFQEELMFCGTHSGRNVDKFKECAISVENGTKSISPVIKLNGVHFECKIVHTTRMSPDRLSSDISKYYSSGDLHTLYSGVIETCYET